MKIFSSNPWFIYFLIIMFFLIIATIVYFMFSQRYDKNKIITIQNRKIKDDEKNFTISTSNFDSKFYVENELLPSEIQKANEDFANEALKKDDTFSCLFLNHIFYFSNYNKVTIILGRLFVDTDSSNSLYKALYEYSFDLNFKEINKLPSIFEMNSDIIKDLFIYLFVEMQYVPSWLNEFMLSLNKESSDLESDLIQNNKQLSQEISNLEKIKNLYKNKIIELKKTTFFHFIKKTKLQKIIYHLKKVLLKLKSIFPI